MTQIQQLTALAFARDDRSSAARPTPASADPADAAQTDSQTSEAGASDAATSTAPSVAAATTAPGQTAGGQRAGSSAAAAAADFADARTDGSEWASGFIAEARRQNEAQGSSGLSGECAGMPHHIMWYRVQQRCMSLKVAYEPAADCKQSYEHCRIAHRSYAILLSLLPLTLLWSCSVSPFCVLALQLMLCRCYQAQPGQSSVFPVAWSLVRGST